MVLAITQGWHTLHLHSLMKKDPGGPTMHMGWVMGLLALVTPQQLATATPQRWAMGTLQHSVMATPQEWVMVTALPLAIFPETAQRMGWVKHLLLH